MNSFYFTQTRKMYYGFESVELTGGFSVFQAQTWSDFEGTPKTVGEGFCLTEQLMKAQSDNTYHPKYHRLEVRPGRELKVKFVDSTLVESFARKTFDAISSEMAKCDFNHYKGLTQDQLSRLVPIYEDVGAHMVFDGVGLPLPRLYRCDYLDGGFSSLKYDLEAVHSHLQGRSDVLNLSTVDVVEEHDTCKEFGLSFQLIPQKDLYQKAWTLALAKNKDHPSTDILSLYLNELDGLGLNQFKI